MKLKEVLDVGELVQGSPETEICGIHYDSRRVEPGSLFVAVPGFRDDGHRFVENSLCRGAVAVAVERPLALPGAVGVLRVPSARQALADLACRYYQHPSHRLRAIGVTGTNGKTTTTHLIRSILMEQGYRVGLLGTVHNYIGDDVLPVEHTTPEAPDLQRHLARMVAVDSQYAVMEVSSHALELHRVSGVAFDVAVFTNLTQDHLDFHGDLDHYRAAKAKLFASLGLFGAKAGPRTAVINADDSAADYLRSCSDVPVVTYGIEAPADVRAYDIRLTAAGAHFRMATEQGDVPVHLRLAGRFNVYNALAAMAVGLAEGCDLLTVVRALARTQGVAGRLESVHVGQHFGLYVDYAHTPDGLSNVLATARSFCQGRLIVVFGAGGDRDRSKRPKMGAVATELADIAVVTSDNPRSEPPRSIIEDILAGSDANRDSGCAVEVLEDRHAAIGRAVELAAPGDVVIIAGKGHETYQIIGTRNIPFDDREVARSHILARLQREKGESA